MILFENAQALSVILFCSFQGDIFVRKFESFCGYKAFERF